MTVLVDSDIIIEVTRGKNADIVARWERLTQEIDPVLFSAVSAAELWAGARPSEHGLFAELFEALVCVPISEALGRKAGEYLNRYGKSHALELGDALIAACAVASGAALWTRNRKHYPMPELLFT